MWRNDVLLDMKSIAAKPQKFALNEKKSASFLININGMVVFYPVEKRLDRVLRYKKN